MAQEHRAPLSRLLDTIGTAAHRLLVDLIKAEREALELKQGDVAKKLRKNQSWVSRLECGGRRIDVVEFFRLANALGFDPFQLLRKWDRALKK